METCVLIMTETPAANCTRLLKNKGPESSRERNWPGYNRFTNFQRLEGLFSLGLRVSALPNASVKTAKAELKGRKKRQECAEST